MRFIPDHRQVYPGLHHQAHFTKTSLTGTTQRCLGIALDDPQAFIIHSKLQLDRHIAPQGLAVIQSTSPLYARKSFWCVVKTLESVGLQTTPYHVLVPSFGEWGFVIAGRSAYQPPATYPVATRFLDADTTPQLFHFPKDMARVHVESLAPIEINQLNNQVLVRYFEEEWRKVIR